MAAFSAGMAVGRLIGDAVHTALGRALVLQGGMALVAFALLGQALLGMAATTVPALFLAGVGAANSAPLLLGAAGSCGDMAPGAAIAATTMMGDLGLLFVAPLLGIAAQPTSFAVTFACAGGLAACGAVVARRYLSSRRVGFPGSDG